MLRKVVVVALLLCLGVVALAVAQESQPPKGTKAYVVKLIAPKEGELWQENSNQAIVWDTQAPVPPDSVRIVLVNGKKELLLTVFHKENPGKWEWVKIGPVGKALKLEVAAYFKGVKARIVANTFAIEPDAGGPGGITGQSTPLAPVYVKVPNGKELWAIGASKLIEWSLVNPKEGALVDIYLSRDGGKNYSDKIAVGLNYKATEYKWVVTGPASDMCRVKVMMHTSTMPTELEDVSDGDFRIWSDATKPIDPSQNH